MRLDGKIVVGHGLQNDFQACQRVWCKSLCPGFGFQFWVSLCREHLYLFLSSEKPIAICELTRDPKY